MTHAPARFYMRYSLVGQGLVVLLILFVINSYTGLAFLPSSGGSRAEPLSDRRIPGKLLLYQYTTKIKSEFERADRRLLRQASIIIIHTIISRATR